jgi:hypothetical protein
VLRGDGRNDVNQLGLRLHPKSAGHLTLQAVQIHIAALLVGYHEEGDYLRKKSVNMFYLRLLATFCFKLLNLNF